MGDDLRWLDGIAQAQLASSDQLSSVELVEAAIARAEDADPALGFLIEQMYEQALAQAGDTAAGGPLAGVPIVMKDHLATCAGVRHTSGSRFLRDYVAPRDSELVVRYKRGGLIPIGTSASCEFALLSTAESALHGPCRNPWDLSRSTGGSSGGAGAAVSAGVVAIAHGNDAGGSIRIPASCCGVFGLKPTRARNPLGPDFGDMAGGIWAEHVLTRSVRDSAAVLDISHSSMPGDPYAVPAPTRAFLEEVGRDPGRLHIALMVDAPTGVAVDEDCKAAAQSAAQLCQELGHTVEEVTFPVDARTLEEAFLVIFAAGAAWRLAAWMRILGREPTDGELEPFTAAVAELGRSFNAAELLLAVEKVQADTRQIEAFYARYDVLLSPALAATPVRLGHFVAPPDDPIAPLAADAAFSAFTWIANATGQPSMSLPLEWNDDNLPIGVLFTGPYAREDLLFRLASQLEAARPWADRHPPPLPAGA